MLISAVAAGAVLGSVITGGILSIGSIRDGNGTSQLANDIQGAQDTSAENDTKIPAENQSGNLVDTQTSETSGGVGQTVENISDWNLLLVNPWNELPENFTVNLTRLKNSQAVDERAYPDLQEMMDAARAEGLDPLICSSYRTAEKQQTLYDRQVKKYRAMGYPQEEAEAEAGKWVAVPGTSEHQTGLAVDIVAASYQKLDEKQADTAEQKWLMENSWKYGFILRYPAEKSEITGIYYEPWHYRYVGKAAAKAIYEQGICLEEYLMSRVNEP